MDNFTNAPGKKTSEYAATVFTQFLSATIGLIALFSPGFTIDSSTQGFVVSFATSGFALSGMVYAWSRGKVKQNVALASVAPSMVVEKAETVVTASPTSTGQVGIPPQT